MTNKEKANVSYNMLNDIVEHFGKDVSRRCIIGGACYYAPKSKNIENNIGCAIGMYLDWNLAKKLDKLKNSSINKIYCKEKYKKLFPKWMQEINISILSEMQNLHDRDSNWYEKGLTHAGEYQVNCIKERIKTTYKY